MTLTDTTFSPLRRGFTLIELLVVIGMIAVLMGAMTVSVSHARQRAQIQKAVNDVKVISQAILAYENWARSSNYELPTFQSEVDCDNKNLGFLLGKEAAASGGKIPAMLMAQLRNGKMLDPWGHPYKVRIKPGTVSAAQGVNLSTGYCLPNYWRLGPGERQ